jgi:quinohemoprotein ethanol dehydrogenase
VTFRSCVSIVSLLMAFAWPAFGQNDGSWPVIGGDPAEQRFSPLTEIDRSNINRLGFAWEGDVDSTRGLEATPIMVDGVIYVTSTWSRVYAFDAARGGLLWSYDPEVPRKDQPRVVL